MSKAAPRRSLLAFLKIAFLNIAGLIFCAVFLEVLFGRWIDDSPVTAVPEIARTAGRSITFRTHGLTGEDVMVDFARDADGLRGRSSNSDKPLILVLGGSTGIEQNVPLSDTWAEILEAQLKSFGQEFDVVNSSVSGHTLYGNEYSIRFWLSRLSLSPRMVIVYYGHNDAVYTMNGVGPAGRDFSRLKLLDLKGQFLRKSAFLMLYRETLGNYQALVKGNSNLYNYQPSSLPGENEGFQVHSIPTPEASPGDIALAKNAVSGLYEQLRKAYPLASVAFVAQSNPNCRFTSEVSYITGAGRNLICENLGTFHMLVRNYLSSKSDPAIHYIPLYLSNPYDRTGSSDEIHTNSRGSKAIGLALAPAISNLLKSSQSSVR